MHALTRLVSTVSDFYKDLNPATLSGAIDVVVIERPDGSLACSPFHVRFGCVSLPQLSYRAHTMQENALVEAAGKECRWFAY
jgi:phosphatidate phosphatase PAH1